MQIFDPDEQGSVPLREELARLRLRKESLNAGYKHTFDLAGVGIAHVDLEGRLLDVNGRFCEMTGFDRNELLGRSFRDITYPADIDDNHNLFQQLKRGQIPGYRMQKRYVKASGEFFWADLTVSAHLDTDGTPIKLISIINDISKQKENEERFEFLMGELSHRTKNLVTILQAIVNRTSASVSSVEEFRSAIVERLTGVVASQDALTSREGASADLDRLAAAQLAVFVSPDDPRVAIHGPRIALEPNATRALGMAFHELATNACKYGALSTSNGSVEISWGEDPTLPDHVRLTWVERGGPGVAEPKRYGFGRSMIERMVGISTGGKVELNFAPQGLEWVLVAPLSTISVAE